MNTATETHTDTLEQGLRLLGIIKAELQIMVTLTNAIGAQEAAHEYSKQLCEVLALEFKLNPHSRRTR